MASEGPATFFLSSFSFFFWGGGGGTAENTFVVAEAMDHFVYIYIHTLGSVWSPLPL